jgi:hypothetical protein
MKPAGGRQKAATSRAWVDGSWVLAVAMFAASSALAAGELDLAHGNETLGITLRVYNYEHLAPAVLTGSEKITTTILKQAGVETAWVDCPVSPGQLQNYPACQAKMGTTDFALRILTRSMAAKLSTSNDPLGFTQHCPDDERGCVVNIFYARVDELASQVVDDVAFQGEDTRAARILGHAMAHEVGHLLLGPKAHSPVGIMRGIWSPDDLRLMAWSYLLFTPDQSDRLRADLVRRVDLELHSTASLFPGN